MTQEEKQLLLKDLCGRLTTDVMIAIEGKSDRLYLNGGMLDLMWSGKMNYKPYLRPMPSMTEEEEDELNSARMGNYGEDVDWLNAHHFDYRGLIEKGLAIEAPEDVYK